MGIVIAELCEFAEWLNPTVLIKGSMPIPREVSSSVLQGLVSFSMFFKGLNEGLSKESPTYLSYRQQIAGKSS